MVLVGGANPVCRQLLGVLTCVRDHILESFPKFFTTRRATLGGFRVLGYHGAQPHPGVLPHSPSSSPPGAPPWGIYKFVVRAHILESSP